MATLGKAQFRTASPTLRETKPPYHWTKGRQTMLETVTTMVVVIMVLEMLRTLRGANSYSNLDQQTHQPINPPRKTRQKGRKRQK